MGEMDSQPVRLFRHGNGTGTMVSADRGKRSHRIIRKGDGQYLDQSFASVADAEQHALAELAKDPGAMFYVLAGDEIARTLLNEAFRNQKEKRSRWRYGVASTVGFALLAFWLSPFFGTGRFVFAASIVVAYCALLWLSGAGNIEAAVLMVIVLVLISLLVPAIRKAQRRKAESSSPLLRVSVVNPRSCLFVMSH